MWSFGRDRSTRTVASCKIDGGKKRRHVFIIVSQQEEYCHGASTQRTGTCERLGASTGLRTRERLLTQRRDLKCGIRARKEKLGDKPNHWNCCLDPSTFSAPSMVRNETVTSGGAPCRCPRLALSSSYGALPRPSGSLCVQSETNRSKFFLLKAILSMDSTQSRLFRDLQW